MPISSPRIPDRAPRPYRPVNSPMNLPDCARIDELLSNSLDDALTPEEQADVDSHLARCPACVRRLRGYVATVAALKAAGEAERDEVPPPIPESLVARILAARAAAVASGVRTERRSG